MDYSTIIDDTNEIYEDGYETEMESATTSQPTKSIENKSQRITDLLKVSESDYDEDDESSENSDEDDNGGQRSRKVLTELNVKNGNYF